MKPITENNKPNNFQMNPNELNVFSPEDIMKNGGAETFSGLIGNDRPIPVPNLDFSQEEWLEIETYLQKD